jgi:hypothetical protein
MKSEARPDQLVAFARSLREALPIKYRDLPPAAFNQTGTFELPGGIRDGWPFVLPSVSGFWSNEIFQPVSFKPSIRSLSPLSSLFAG